MTSMPLTTAPTGLIRSWQTREHSSAARSRHSRVTGPDMRVSDVRSERKACDSAVEPGSRCDTPQPMDQPQGTLDVDAGKTATRTRLARTFTDIAFRAAAAILRFDCRNVSMRQKADESPVTAGRRGRAGGDPARPRRGASRRAGRLGGGRRPGGRSPGATFLLVDPLDGTREFLAGRDEYTVNIALVRGGVPVVGVVAAPALGLVWRGGAGTRRTGAHVAGGRHPDAVRDPNPRRGRQRACRGGQPLALRGSECGVPANDSRR